MTMMTGEPAVDVGSGWPRARVVRLGTDRDELALQVREALARPCSAAGGPEVLSAAALSDCRIGDVVLLDHAWPALSTGGVQGVGAPVIVGLVGERQALLDAGAAVGSQYLVELPVGAQWLADLVAARVGAIEEADLGETLMPNQHVPAPPIAGPAAGSATSGVVVGVVGCVGGLGASTLAVAVAHAASESGAALIVQADPWDFGIDAALSRDAGCEPGWAAISPTATLLDPESLRSTLPRESQMWVLTGALPDDCEVPAALPAVLAAARDGFQLSVIDFGRSLASLNELGNCDFAVVVVPAAIPGLLSARLLLERLRQVPGGPAGGPQVRVVVRDGGPVPATVIESMLEHPVSSFFRPSRFLAERAAAGELLGGRSGRRLAKLGRTILESL